MKKLKCPSCGKIREVEDNILFKVCGGCQEEMKEVKDGNRTRN